MNLNEAKDGLGLAFLESWRRGTGCGPAEADDELNNASRSVIQACHDEYGAAWLGMINRYAGDSPGLWLWEPESMVYNFGADFVLPVASEELVILIGHYRNTPLCRCAEWADRLCEIADGIDRAGGVMLCWS